MLIQYMGKLKNMILSEAGFEIRENIYRLESSGYSPRGYEVGTLGGDILPFHLHISHRGPDETGYQIKNRRFSCAIWPDEPHDVALLNTEIEAADRC